MKAVFCVLIALLCLTGGSSLWAEEIPEELLNLDLEQLMEMEVTSAARHPQKFRDAPSAIYLITAEDLHRSFDNQLPELLRGVPGVHVARVTSSDWAISIRGFNDRFANKLLVLMDGRTLYTPLFSGVFWERQDTVIEDLDRIEIIRGPGASLWGANAVNGVINFVTKSAWETQGWLSSVVVGTEESEATLRYGGMHEDDLAYRVYVKVKEVGSLKVAHDGSAHDDWRMGQTGFRLDWNVSEHRKIRLSGDAYTQTASVLQSQQDLTSHDTFKPTDGYGFGANIVFKIEEELKDRGWYFQAYYDTARATGYPLLNWDLDIIDAEFLHHLSRNHHEWTWGLGYRLYISDVKRSATYAYDPAHSKTYVLNAFIQDELDFRDGTLKFIWGSKFEYNEDVGLEVQPTARFLWKLTHNQTLWAAVSRAVRTPSKGELDAVIDLLFPPSSDSDLPFVLHLEGNKDLDSEKLIAFELGYRYNHAKKVSLDVATFFNLYDDLVAFPVPETPEFRSSPVPHLYATTKAENLMDGEAYGLEASLRLNPASRFFFLFNYTYLKLFLHSDKPTVWLGEELEDQWPKHLFSFVGCYTVLPNLHVDFRVNYTSKLKSFGVPSYLGADVKLHWYFNKNLELSLVAQNIFDSEHPEFGQTYALRTPLREVQRAAFLKLIWKH